jgi:hypothetical protein
MPTSAIVMLVITAFILFGGIAFCIAKIKVKRD